MKTAIALRHVHFEDAGLLGPLLAAHGYRLKHVDATLDNLDDPALEQADLLVVLGGPVGAYDELRYPFIARELALIRRRLRTGLPLLGICLGAQLIARALGARVYPLGVQEIGLFPLRLTPEGEASVLSALGAAPVLHWHGDQFDIPAEGVRLAGTEVGENQAFAVGHHILGLQFHLEADLDRLEPWLVGHASELAQAGIDPRALRTEAARAAAPLAHAARQVFSRWLDRLDQGTSGA